MFVLGSLTVETPCASCLAFFISEKSFFGAKVDVLSAVSQGQPSYLREPDRRMFPTVESREQLFIGPLKYLRGALLILCRSHMTI